MGKQTIKADTTAEAYLTLLADRGVDYLFGNAGTDFASVIEALSKAQLGESKAPTPVTVPHENVAVAMAHGFYLATGRPQAVMLHVTVGTREWRVWHHERGARTNSHAVFCWQNANNGRWIARRPQYLYSLGPGNVRPSRHGP